MYIAKQVDPEWQEDNLFYTYKDKNGHYQLGWNDDVYEENVIIYGNDEFKYSLTKEVQQLLKLDEWYDEYELSINPKSNHCYWRNASECINYYLPKNNGKYTMKEIHQWKELLEKYSQRWNLEDIVCEALKLMTGKNWRSFTMRGDCQRDWQCGYASEEITYADMEYIEMCYFNTGEEYIVYEENDEENGIGYYVDSYNPKEELCKHIGCEPNELKVYKFVGYQKTPKYELEE